MNPPNMIFHIIHPTETPSTPIPLTDNAGIMLRLVTSTILLAREPALLRLRTALVPAEQMLAVTIKVFPQITAPPEEGLRGTARIGASPDPVAGGDAVAGEIGWVEGGRGWVAGGSGFEVGEDGWSGGVGH